MRYKTDVQKEYIRRIRNVFVPVAALALLAVCYLIYKSVFQIRTYCWSYAVLGVVCPGCGGTRMAFSLLKGDFYQAFRYNPGIFLLVPVCTIVFIKEAISYIRELYLDKWLTPFLYGVIFYLVLYGVMRNIPMFSYLVPTVVR